MVGAGGLVALNHLFNIAPRDGSVLSITDGALVFEALFDNPAAKYDPRQVNWIGSRARETPLCAAQRTKGAETIQEATRNEVVVGAVAGAGSYRTPRILNALIGTKFKIVTGYPGSSEMILGMERGELDGVCGWSWSTIKRRVPDWLRERKVALLVQTGLEKATDLPDVPLALDLASSDDEREIMRLLLSDSQLATPLLAPPGVPASAVVALRDAFNASMKDPLLLGEAQHQQIDIDPTPGMTLQASVERMFSLPASLVVRAKKLFQ
jgi:tripartite-type tricarboxylate transporter receptor subunit TctC